MTSLRVALIGMGRMGRAVAALAPERECEVVATLDAARMRGGITRDALAGADVAIEFTAPDAAPANIRALVDAGCPVVVGTTGWYDSLPDVSAYVKERGGAMLWAPNFSVGVYLFQRIVADAARLLRAVPGFHAHIVETHHQAKKDAPSGTAKSLERVAATALGHPVPITSVRVGHVPGTHELIFDAPFETIHLTHLARDRRVFAEGALLAARWLPGHAGVFEMQDVLDLSTAERIT